MAFSYGFTLDGDDEHGLPDELMDVDMDGWMDVCMGGFVGGEIFSFICSMIFIYPYYLHRVFPPLSCPDPPLFKTPKRSGLDWSSASFAEIRSESTTLSRC